MGGGGGVCVLLIIETKTVYENTITAYVGIAHGHLKFKGPLNTDFKS